MKHEGKCVDRLISYEDIQLYQIAFPISREIVIKRSVAARNGFQPILEIEDNLIQGQFISQQHAI